MTGGLGFFFLPILGLKPNRLAGGIPFNLLEIQGDLRYVMLFILALLPIVLAFRKEVESRGWLLVSVGNLVLLLSLLLPAQAAQMLLENASSFLGENALVRNPRVLASSGLALGLLGGYMTVFAGVRDLKRAGVAGWIRTVSSWVGVALIALLLINGSFDIYSLMVEFTANGDALSQRFVEHLLFVAISLAVGTVVGVGLGLWAARDERISPLILYTVGIIQTVPSLALFGLLLEPMAALGRRSFWTVAIVVVLSALLAAALFWIYQRFAEELPKRLRAASLIGVSLVAGVPLVLTVGVLASFLMETAKIAFGNPRFAGLVQTFLVLGVLALVVWVVKRSLFRPDRTASRAMLWVARGLGAASGVALVVLFVQAAGTQQLLGGVESLGALQVRDLGLRGIGTAPAIVALTLYSLLPLVRNTYAGLNNVDNAIIDSGRGMGMTPSQIFLQIELPLATPVIMAGVRNAGIALVGIGTVATVIGAGGLGDFVINGISSTSIDLVLLGTIPAIALALVFDAAMRGVESVVTSPGIKQVQQ